MPFRLTRSDADAQRPDLALLLARIGGADEVALAELYRATSRRVFGLVTSIVRERQAAEEVTLDVYAQVWQQAVTFTPARGAALGWVLAIARSRAIDKARHLARGYDKESLDRLSVELFGSEPSPLDASAHAERGTRVRAALADLPRGQREVVAAAYFQGLTHTEISSALAVPLGTVKTRIRAAMTTLACVLAGLEPEIQ